MIYVALDLADAVFILVYQQNDKIEKLEEGIKEIEGKCVN